MDGEKVYSLDGETYSEYEDIVATLESEHEPGRHKVDVGIVKKVNHINFISGRHIIEGLQESSGDDFGEFAEDYLSGVTDEQTEKLGKHIAAWLDTNVGTPTFYGVDRTGETTINTEEI